MTAPDDVRARFEAWATKRGLLIRRAAMTCGNARGPYDRSEVQSAWEGYRAAHADMAGEVRELVEAARVVERRLIPLLSGKLHDIDHADFVAFFAALAKFTHQEKP